MFKFLGVILLVLFGFSGAAMAQDDPELIFKKNTVFHLLSPDAKLATYVIDDPQITGVACYFTVPEQGGWTGWAGFAEQRSETSLACRQVGPVTIAAKFGQGDDIYEQRRSLFFKTMHIVRGCDQAQCFGVSELHRQTGGWQPAEFNLYCSDYAMGQ